MIDYHLLAGHSTLRSLRQPPTLVRSAIWIRRPGSREGNLQQSTGLSN